jgi:predicted phosphoadenosine phosphosulfate sulfurtransferase
VALTQKATYKWITWGRQLNKKLGHYTFYPIYDWSWSDVWKAIHDNGWQYNRIYDEMYRYGVAIRDMRVSNLHHETAIQSLLLIQEIEPETWGKVADRIAGANTIKHLKKSAFTCPAELPYMFDSWEAYTHHLISNLIQDNKNKITLEKKLAAGLKVYTDDLIKIEFCKVIIKSILRSDWDWTSLANFHLMPVVNCYRIWKKTGRMGDHPYLNKFIPEKS